MARYGPIITLATQRGGNFSSSRWAKTYKTVPVNRSWENPYELRYGEFYGRNTSGELIGPYHAARTWAGDWTYEGDDPTRDGSLDRTDMMSAAQAKAYERFLEDVTGETSAIGVNLAERNQALRMIANRASSLRKAWKYLRKGQWRNSLHSLGLEAHGGGHPWYKVRGKQTLKETANLWLEGWFGWSPLVSDIHNAVGVVTRDYKCLVKGSGSEWRYREVSDDGREGLQECGWIDARVKCRISGQVYISNPDLFLASQLGLTDPLSVAWELIPFSFLADWVSNVGTVIAGRAPLYGLTFTRSRTNYKFEAFSKAYVMMREDDGDTYIFLADALSKGFRLTRVPGFTTPDLRLQLPNQVSWQRAATAVSLLAQVWR